MARASDGDRSAYRKLLEEVGDVMHAYLHKHFGEGDFVEDCVQECLLSLHRARATYDPARRFRPWMFTIVRHKAIDFLRRGGMRARLGVDFAREAPTSDPGKGAETRIEVRQILAGLEPKYREALVLTKLDGYSLSDAAARSGISATAMKTRVHRAITQVRDRLEGEEG
jgi:RNA polymerase sigma-70 factor (ECF subfamily)